MSVPPPRVFAVDDNRVPGPGFGKCAGRRMTTEIIAGQPDDLIRLRPADGHPHPTVAQLLASTAGSGDPSGLDPYIRGLLVIGHLLIEGDEAEHIVLDGATGRVFSMYLFEESPDLTDVLPLAPSRDALTRFLAATDELARTYGQFARFADRSGPRAVAEASAGLLAVFEDEEWGGDWGSAGDRDEWEHSVPAFWRIAALVRPLALMARPGNGLHLDLPEGVLEEEFGEREVVRFDRSDLPDALMHLPTRRFLTETGLPSDGGMFSLGTEAPRLVSLAACRDEHQDGADLYGYPPSMAEIAGRLFYLGWLVEDTAVFVDGATGTVHAWSVAQATLLPLNADVSTLAFTVWILHREHALDEEHGLTADMYQPLADTMARVLAAVDPVACRSTGEEGDWRYWPEVFHDEPGGVL